MMRAHTRRFLVLLAFLPVVVLTAAGLYMLGMAGLESEPRDFWSALAWAAETITTTGYGGDSSWRHPGMVLFVILTQFFGVILIYMVVPIYLIPYVEERFETRLPSQTPRIRGHVVIYRYGPAVESLLEELRRNDVPAVVIETNKEEARRLVEHRIAPVVHDESAVEALAGARLEEARALIANGPDAEDATVILMARQQGFTGEVLALTEEPYHRQPIALAGADMVFTPHHVLAAALAARASHRISPRVSGAQQLGRHLEVGEMRVDPQSELAGKTLAESDIGAATSTAIVGQWVAGRLQTPATPDLRVEPRGILVAVGLPEGIDHLGRLAGGAAFGKRQGPFVVAGFGQVGQKIRELLSDADEEVRVVDRQPVDGVSQVGDILDPKVLEAVVPGDAQAVILALDSDSATLFATLAIRDRMADVPILARVNEARNVERIYRAGADFALSISQVSGQILAHHLLRQEAVSLDPGLKVLQVACGRSLRGKHPSSLKIRGHTGCSVVAVERGDDVLTSFPPDFRFAADDAVYICGSSEQTHRFAQEVA